MIKFEIDSDYKLAFEQEVDKLIKQEYDDDRKIVEIQELTDSYVNSIGERPDSYQLSRLTTWLVVDKSKNPHKITVTEYPTLSKDQIKLRQRRELASDTLEYRSSNSAYKLNGRKKPKSYRVFGEYEGV